MAVKTGNLSYGKSLYTGYLTIGLVFVPKKEVADHSEGKKAFVRSDTGVLCSNTTRSMNVYV
jgi:hypothetical protein